MKLQTLCNRHNLRIESVMVNGNPNMEDMPSGSYHWKVTLRLKGRQLTTPYSMGPALDHEPRADEVVSCLLSDAQAGALSFSEFCSEFGYDREDPTKARRTYDACARTAKRIPKFLGPLLREFQNAEQP